MVRFHRLLLSRNDTAERYAARYASTALACGTTLEAGLARNRVQTGFPNPDETTSWRNRLFPPRRRQSGTLSFFLSLQFSFLVNRQSTRLGALSCPSVCRAVTISRVANNSNKYSYAREDRSVSLYFKVYYLSF